MRNPRLAWLLLLAAGCLPAQEKPAVIDVHQHFSNRANYFEDLDRVYRANNAKACVNGFIADRKAIQEASKKYPTVIPFGRIRLDDANALEDLKAFKDTGFKGIKIHSPQKNYDDRSYFPIYERAQQLGFVVLFHTGINNRGDPPDLRVSHNTLKWRRALSVIESKPITVSSCGIENGDRSCYSHIRASQPLNERL